jgi:hypothetical protein
VRQPPANINVVIVRMEMDVRRRALVIRIDGAQTATD